MNYRFKLLDKVYFQASQNPQRILLPEAEIDPRVFQAAIQLANDKICQVSVIGNTNSLLKKIKEENPQLVSQINIFDSDANNQDLIKYANQLYQKRKHKGMTQEEAYQLMQNVNYYACSLLNDNKVDGIATGATFTTKEVFQPALKILGTKDQFHRVSSYFIMLVNEQELFFADCAVNINPNARELAEIAIDTANTAKVFGLEPQIALLSFSTYNSASDESIDKIQAAIKIIKEKAPQLVVDGEMQVDAALIPEIRSRKAPNSPITKSANVLIFPDLNSGNIAYKLVERLAKAQAVGPILQGFKKPFNDFSRGCSTQDIYDIAAITAIESINNLS